MMNTQPNEAFRICVFAHHNRSEYVALDDFPNYYDLTFVLSGSLCYLIDGKMTDIVAGNAVFYPPRCSSHPRQYPPRHRRIHQH